MPFEIKPSRTTLVELPQRAMAFLRGVGTSPDVYDLLADAGYDEEAHAEGWKLLLDVSGYHLPQRPPRALYAAALAVREASDELDRWSEQGLRRIRAALTRNHPEQAAFVFGGLEPTPGSKVILVIHNLLDRLSELEAGRSDATREADRAAVATLVRRGITPEERQRLAALVEAAKGGAVTLEERIDDSRAVQEQGLMKLYAWYSDWAETARAVVSRRDQLIRLGLAKRRPNTDEGSASGEERKPGIEPVD